MFCSQCGAETDGHFCWKCGALLHQDTISGQPNPKHLYSALVSSQQVKSAIKYYARQYKPGISEDELMGIIDKASIPSFHGISLRLVTSLVVPLAEKMGLKTGKQRTATFPHPLGKVIVYVLCSLARHGYEISSVEEADDACLIEASIPSEVRWAGAFVTHEGSLFIALRARTEETIMECQATIKGQIYDFGKSNRVLDNIFSDIGVLPIENFQKGNDGQSV